MIRKLIKRYLPDPASIRDNRSLKFLGKRLSNPDLWYLNRRSTTLAVFIGIFVAFIPMPFQMVLAAILALLTRCNLPISIGLVWITNPVTMPIMWFATYKLGCIILQIPPLPDHGFEISLEWFTLELSRIWQPLYLGSLVSGLFFAGLSALGIHLFWRWHVIRAWRHRARRTKKQQNTNKEDTNIV